MRYLIIMLCIILASVTSTSQQHIKDKRAPKIEKKIEKEQAQRVQPVDAAAFYKSLAPLEDDIFANNKEYKDVLRTRKGTVIAENILKDIDLTQRTDIKIAEDVDVLVVLNPIDPLKAKLSYYTTTGTLIWQKNISFASTGFNMSNGWTRIEVSSDGKRIAIYATADDISSIYAVYDENGNEIPAPKKILEMAPSGNYFYTNDEMYAANFSKVELGDKTFLQKDTSKFLYRTQSRVFENDILVRVIAEITSDRDIRKRQLHNKHLFIYDLKARRIITSENLMSSTQSFIDAFLEDKWAQGKNNRLICTLYDNERKHSYLYECNTKTAETKKTEIASLSSVILSVDGTYTLFSHGDAKNIKNTIMNLDTRQIVFDNLITNGLVYKKNFVVGKNGVRIQCENFKGNPSLTNVFIFSSAGINIQSVSGWIDLKRGVGLLPSKESSSLNQLEIIKETY